MYKFLIGAIVNFGVSSVMGNVATKLILESGKKTMDKVGIGFGSLLLTEMISDVTTKHYVNKIDNMLKIEQATPKLIDKQVKEASKENEAIIKEAEETIKKLDDMAKAVDDIIEVSKKPTKKTTKKKEEKKNGGEISE